MGMDYGNIPICESSRFSFSDWVYTLKSPKSFMMRLAKQCIMLIQHKTFWSIIQLKSLIVKHSQEHSSELTFN